MSTHRRDFLRSSLAASTLVSIGGSTIPGFLARSARAAGIPAGGDRILVVVQLLGGNDGLNTVVPHGIDGYHRNRRRLRLAEARLHRLDDEIGLHPGMGRMAELVEGGRLAIAQGVGYPNPDRSHFRSMEIWETARLDNRPDALEAGWLGRSLDQHPPRPGEDTPALHIGGGRSPLAMKARSVAVPSLERLDQFKLQLAGSEGERRSAREAMGDVARPDRGDDPLLGFLRRSTLAAYESSRRLEEVVGESAESSYPNYDLARRLEQIARIIKAGFGTRIYYTRQDGYDTHANQLDPHAALLNELSDSLAAFHDDLDKAGLADRVAVLVFSEFGRRVGENASHGTDHGAAAPVFVVGPVRQAGLVGEHPGLEEADLDEGDLRFHTDFRRVYAAMLGHWLGVPAAPIVGEGFDPLPLLPESRG
ncbi:DUF1501 domain-containing protein [Tautonia plasticadhaerens]|uniref:DUF1501 domain-containing protein n=1 Tax=Tautonia plasticadhaerens TaxID=2527974 RepID=A0A518GXT7_9BACT|nr:DUF1501 domain-containing protein [Tautonia plasticadhaerens]QDV33383.1 hypothetical protein ElP_12540 [Tautonia plasticadhaerens]